MAGWLDQRETLGSVPRRLSLCPVLCRRIRWPLIRCRCNRELSVGKGYFPDGVLFRFPEAVQPETGSRRLLGNVDRRVVKCQL